MTCYQKFLSNERESIPVGRSFNDDSNNAFNKLCLWLESEAGTKLSPLTNYKKKWKGFPNQMKHTQPSG